MSISYDGLWEKLKEQGLQKKNLVNELNISSATVAKMGKGEAVSMDVMQRICEKLNCNIGDIMSFEKEERDV